MRAVGLGACSAMARVGAIVTPFVAQVVLNANFCAFCFYWLGFVLFIRRYYFDLIYITSLLFIYIFNSYNDYYLIEIIT